MVRIALRAPIDGQQSADDADGASEVARRSSRCPPLDEQRRIVARVEEQLSAIDALRAAIERAQRRSASLRRAVLERAFRGELVPQDPSDEPASVLLERIRAERAAAPPAIPAAEGEGVSAQNGLVQRLWSYCNVLRDDGLSYGDYVEQLTYLLFLKMADEQTKPPFSRDAIVPEGLDWPSLLERDGDELEVHYRHVLTELGRRPGMLGVVFRKAQNRIQDPAKLRRLIVDLIDRESWMTLDADVKGDAYEGLLEKNAEDMKSGAGQYFTPRPLIRAIVEVMRPEPGDADRRPGVRHRRLPARRARVDRAEPPARPRREAAPPLRGAARAGRSSTTRRGCA